MIFTHMPRKRTPASVLIGRRIQRSFGARLRAARRGRASRLLQQDLAEALDVTRTTISNMERGQHRIFLDQVYIVAHHLGISIDALLPSLDEIFPPRALTTPADERVEGEAVDAAIVVAEAVIARALARTGTAREKRRGEQVHRGTYGD